MKCKAVCDEITHVFQIKTFLLKFLVGERFRVDSHSLHYQFIVVWSRHLVLASTFAFHEEGVYFIVLQDWTSQFIVVWANTSSWPWALHSKTQTLHVISHEWSRSVNILLCAFVWDTKLYFPCAFPTIGIKAVFNLVFAKCVKWVLESKKTVFMILKILQ